MESQNNPVDDRGHVTTMPAQSPFVKWLNDYKELLSVIIFFIGGFLWVYGVFATKEQIKELKCLMNANITIINSQIDESALSQLLIENLQEQSKQKQRLPGNDVDQGKFNDVDQRKFAQLAAAALDIQNKLQRATGLRAEASQKLRANECND